MRLRLSLSRCCHPFVTLADLAHAGTGAPIGGKWRVLLAKLGGAEGQN